MELAATRTRETLVGSVLLLGAGVAALALTDGYATSPIAVAVIAAVVGGEQLRHRWRAIPIHVPASIEGSPDVPSFGGRVAGALIIAAGFVAFVLVSIIPGGGGGAALLGFLVANPSQFVLRIKLNAKLLPVLHATEVVGFAEDGWEYDYVTKGYFKVGGKTVARLPQISGHADRTEEHLRRAIKRSTRSTIRAAGKRRGTRRVILILVHRLTLTASYPGAVAPRTQTVTQHAFLTIPRN